MSEIDVTKCENYFYGDCNVEHDGCAENSNCLFKQLAHKTQECESLKRKSEEQSWRYAELDADFEQLKAENEKLKNEIEACYNQVEDFDIIATNKSNKLQQAEQKLERIRDIANNYKNCNDVGRYVYDSEARYALWKVAQAMCDILQIIDGVENDG